MADSSGGALTIGQAKAALEDAISFGELAEQHAPAGHAIFAAVDDAKGELDDINALVPWWSSGSDSTPLPRTSDAVNAATQAIYDAAADLKVDPDQPLPPTIFPPAVTAAPWGWIAGGAAAVAGLVYYFRFYRRRRFA